MANISLSGLGLISISIQSCKFVSLNLRNTIFIYCLKPFIHIMLQRNKISHSNNICIYPWTKCSLKWNDFKYQSIRSLLYILDNPKYIGLGMPRSVEESTQHRDIIRGGIINGVFYIKLYIILNINQRHYNLFRANCTHQMSD